VVFNDERKWKKNLLSDNIKSYENQKISEESLRLYSISKRQKGLIELKTKKLNCYFKANIRPHGNFMDHRGGLEIPSLNINLEEGNVKGITQFLLLRPETRNYGNEIFNTVLFKKFGFLSPVTFNSNLIYNNKNHKVIFQEKIVKEFPRVGYEINKSRLGIAENFNKCLNRSTGVFTQICGSDDIFIGDPTICLSRFNLADTKISVVGMNVKTINEQGIEKVKLPDIIKKFISPNVNGSTIFKNSKIFANLMVGDWLYFPAIMWRTSTVLNYKFSGEFHTAMDLDILLRIISDELKIGFVNEYVIGYRRHDKSASSLYAKSIHRVEEEYLCHRYAISIAKRNKWILGLIFAQIAPTVRAHALL
jgi:hypothetical protein